MMKCHLLNKASPIVFFSHCFTDLLQLLGLVRRSYHATFFITWFSTYFTSLSFYLSFSTLECAGRFLHGGYCKFLQLLLRRSTGTLTFLSILSYFPPISLAILSTLPFIQCPNRSRPSSVMQLKYLVKNNLSLYHLWMSKY